MKFSDLLEPEELREAEPEIKKEGVPTNVNDVVKKKENVKEPIDVDREVYLEFNKRILRILKDVDKIMFLASKRRIGVNLLKALFDLSADVLEYRKFLSNKNQLVNGGTASRMFRNERKFSQLILSQFIPFLSGNDKTLKAELLNEWNKKA